MTKTLRESIAEAGEKRVAIGHFNISNIEALWAVFRAAQELSVPVIIGVSEGERDFVGVRQAVALVRSLREEFDYPVFINADHTYSFDRVKEAIDAGFDSVIYDGAKLSVEENQKITKQCVEYARASGRDVLVEAELGYIGQSSKVWSEIPQGVSIDPATFTKPEVAAAFVQATGIDLFAPSVGNIHGMMGVGKDPHLDIPLIAEIRAAAGVPMVLHGGSGTPDEDFQKAIDAGMSIIHISTELRVAYRKGMERTLRENPDEVAPYRIMKKSVENMKAVALERLKLFNKIS
ncbi:MAG TPA: class II fructose-bisphosphate aldolase [Candidatus Paceibacterota bacterium]|nr:class II fructose-bisphosphate aldolase [Candidatus Paceibacterota bacterium]